MIFVSDCCIAEHDGCDPCCLCGEPEDINDEMAWVVIDPSRTPGGERKRLSK